MRTSVNLIAHVKHKTPTATRSHRRSHEHSVDITFTVSNPMNLKTGMTVPAERLFEDCSQAFHAAGYDLNAIDGIHPTFESYALYLRERLLSKYPTMQVTIKDMLDNEYSVSTE